MFLSTDLVTLYLNENFPILYLFNKKWLWNRLKGIGNKLKVISKKLTWRKNQFIDFEIRQIFFKFRIVFNQGL